MKRYIRLIALILAFVTLFSFSGSAEEYDSRWVSFLDYDTANDNGNYLNFTGSGAFEYTLPFTVSVRSFQGIFQSSGAAPTSVYITRKGSTTTYPCTLLSLGNSVYRFYLTSSSSAINSSEFTLHIETGGSSNTVVTLLAFEYSEIRSVQFAETGTMQVGNSVYTMSSSSSSVTHDFGMVTGPYLVNLSCSSWKKYDRISFFYYGYGPDVNSITARFGTFSLPVDVSYLVADGYNSVRYSTMITVDLSGIDRTKTDVPIVEISGYRRPEGEDLYLSLLSVSGYVDYDPADPLLFYFRELEAAFAQRQDAYHEDLMEWNNSFQNSLLELIEQHDTYMYNRFSNLILQLDDISTQIQNKISTLQTTLVNKLTSFQNSMETYLEALPARIAEEIAKIFKPTEGKFEAAADESKEIAEDRLGAVYQAATVVDQIAGSFTEQTVQTSISIPVVRIMILPDVPFEFGGWDVSVVPDGMGGIIETLKYVIDIVCTLAFLNGMKRRLEGFFGGESNVD